MINGSHNVKYFARIYYFLKLIIGIMYTHILARYILPITPVLFEVIVRIMKELHIYVHKYVCDRKLRTFIKL